MSAKNSTIKYWFVSDTAVQLEPVVDTQCDLLTFLAVLQRLELDILPITWQAARGLVGRGGTSRINEALIDLQTSFAFKCVSKDQKEKTSKSKIFQALISEIRVLSHPLLRDHPNIVELQGICWDVQSDNEVWPVLVFEKTQFGDLYNFLTLPVGRDLSMAERLKLCVEIGSSIIDMHHIGIIHGDIKPENVLIFKDDTNSYCAKLTDFGYSTIFANHNDVIPMPTSWPWNPPENEHKSLFKPTEARKMDIFSFGMLCLWVLFERFLSTITPLPQETLWVKDYFANNGDELASKNLLDALKREDKLVLLSQQLLSLEQDLAENEKHAVRQFFSVSLKSHPDLRAADLKRSLCCLIPDRILPQPLRLDGGRCDASDYSFEIIPSVDSLYESDYRVRSYIRRCLEEKVQTNMEDYRRQEDKNFAFQLAFSYKVGFGVARSDQFARKHLLESGKAEEELEAAIHHIRERDVRRKGLTGMKYRDMLLMGHIYAMDPTDQYLQSKKLADAEAEIRRELQDITTQVEEDSRIVVSLIDTLAKLVSGQGRWKEAEQLDAQVVEARKRVLGEEHPDTLASIANLASTYRNQGLWTKAEQLFMRVIEIKKTVLGIEHPSTLASTANLAWTFCNQSQWTKAEQLFVQVIETRKMVFGEEHPSTLTSMANLATTYRDQGRWTEAEKLFIQVIETNLRVLGAENPSTLASMNNLATTYRNQGRWTEAEQLFMQVRETSSRVLGEEHPSTLTSMDNTAATFSDQGRWIEAEQLFMQVRETSSRVLGAEHPETLTSMNNLATMYWNQGRWTEAEQLYVQVMETRKRVLGIEHSDTLISMTNLAATFSDRGRWTEAEELEVQVMETSSRVFGAEHPLTLNSMANLATSFLDQSRWTEAEELGVQVMETRKRVFGAEHPSTLTSMNNLATTYRDQGRWTEAEQLFMQVRETSSRVLGAEHPSTLTGMANLAATFLYQGRWTEAEELEVQVMETRKRVLGAEHPDTLSSMNNLALTIRE